MTFSGVREGQPVSHMRSAIAIHNNPINSTLDIRHNVEDYHNFCFMPNLTLDFGNT